jgi:hypothetical protein
MLGRGYPDSEARNPREVGIVCRQEGEAPTLHHRDDQRVVDHQAKLLAVLATGVQIAIGEGKNVHACLAQVAEDGAVR